MCYEDFRNLYNLYHERLSLLLYYLSEHNKSFEIISTFFDLDVCSSSAVSIDSMVLSLVKLQDSTEDVIFKLRSIVDVFFTDFVYDVKGVSDGK